MKEKHGKELGLEIFKTKTKIIGRKNKRSK